MAGITIPTNFNIDLEFEKATFAKRLLAWIIDIVIQFLYLIIAYKVVGLAGGAGYENSMWVSTIIFFPVLVYHIVLEILMNGQSIGKKMLGLQVINETGGKASKSQFVIRGLIRTGDFFIIILILIILISQGAAFMQIMILLFFALFVTDIILVAASKKSQRLGDMLAHTIIISTKTSGSIHDTIFLEVEDSYIPLFPEIMRLSDKDINAIKSILDSANERGDFGLAVMAADKIKSHLNIQSNLSPFDFLATALKDYNYLSVK